MNKEARYIGNYRILDIIGKGGMARVFTAIQVPLNRVVVIKELAKSSAADIRKRFKHEALITAALEHPNIVPVYDYFSVGQASYLVMQYVDGVSLAEIIESEAPFHPAAAAAIACEICRAVDYAHKHNVIHRDIKPTNVLVSKDGQLKVTDFGVAKDETARDQTQVGTIIGTPCYMSPEQAAGKKLTAQSDVYSIGIVLYELATGKKPFWGETADEITRKIARGKYRSPLWLAPHHSLRLTFIIGRALKKGLGRRYATVGHLMRDLERFAGWKNRARTGDLLSRLVSRVESRHHATTVIRKGRARRTPRRSKFGMFLLYVLLSVVVAAFIYVLTRLVAQP